MSSLPLASSCVHAWGQRECDTASVAPLCRNPTIIFLFLLLNSLWNDFTQTTLRFYLWGSPYTATRRVNAGSCAVFSTISCSLGGHSEYFGWKDGVNVAISSQNGLARLPDTWVTRHELRGDMFIYLFIYLKRANATEWTLKLRRRPLGGILSVHETRERLHGSWRLSKFQFGENYFFKNRKKWLIDKLICLFFVFCFVNCYSNKQSPSPNLQKNGIFNFI